MSKDDDETAEFEVLPILDENEPITERIPCLSKVATSILTYGGKMEGEDELQVGAMFEIHLQNDKPLRYQKETGKNKEYVLDRLTLLLNFVRHNNPKMWNLDKPYNTALNSNEQVNRLAVHWGELGELIKEIIGEITGIGKVERELSDREICWLIENPGTTLHKPDVDLYFHNVNMDPHFYVDLQQRLNADKLFLAKQGLRKILPQDMEKAFPELGIVGFTEMNMTVFGATGSIFTTLRIPLFSRPIDFLSEKALSAVVFEHLCQSKIFFIRNSLLQGKNTYEEAELKANRRHLSTISIALLSSFCQGLTLNDPTLNPL